MLRKVAVSLFDESGNMLRPWAAAGWECHNFDKIGVKRNLAIGKGKMYWHQADMTDPEVIAFIKRLKPRFISSFGPCTDLAGCGAKHFEKKRLEDPDFQKKALALWKIGPDLGEELDAIWVAENPVGVIPKLWRKWDYIFDPCDYGGYLPHGDQHPRWPQYIPSRDAYTKKTCVWTSKSFLMPPKRSVKPIIIEYENGVRGSPQFAKLGGKSEKTKKIRNETPRGFSEAVCMWNSNAKRQD